MTAVAATPAALVPGSERADLAAGTAAMLASATSMPFGAAVGAHAFATMTPTGVVAVRNLVVALVLLPTARPPLRRLTWAQWWPALTLGTVMVVMNICLATSVGRIGVALAITLEFLGPLSVALAGSRSKLDLACALGAGAGVWVLVQPSPSSDWVGVGAGLVAAAGWAAYILLNRMLGVRLPGFQGTAVTAGVASTFTLPVLVWLAVTGHYSAPAIGFAVAAGVLSSLVPYTCDLYALRRVPARLYGVFMSLGPVMAGLAGVLVLGQLLEPHEWAGIVIVVLVNVVATASAARQNARS